MNVRAPQLPEQDLQSDTHAHPSQTLRKATPDSEAIASSEDERPWPASTSFGSLPRKGSANVSGLPGGIWSNQRRGSLTIAETAQRNAAREAARLAVPNSSMSTMRTGSTPSPATSDGTTSLPFSIPLQPTPKIGRSLSHSQGQRDFLQQGIHVPNAAEHAIPLGLLTEEGDTESDSDPDEAQLTKTSSHPPIGTLYRTSTLPVSHDASSFHGHFGHARPSRNFSGEERSTQRSERPLDAAFARLGFDQLQSRQRAQWQSHLGWDDLPVVNESRRHSLADIPTRRGSIDQECVSSPSNNWFNSSKARDQHHSPVPSQFPQARPQFEPSIEDIRQLHALGDMSGAKRPGEANVNMARFQESLGSSGLYDIPPMYKVPIVAIDESEGANTDIVRQQHQQQHNQHSHQQIMRAQASPTAFRPRKMLYVVSFKCSRVDVFYLLENTGLLVREGDIVIVEADRGQDLGTVQHANVTSDQARIYKRKYSEEQYKWLMMFSNNNAQGNVNPNPTDGFTSSASNGAQSGNMNNPSAATQGLSRDNYNNLKPKAIKRLANPHEIRMLSEKEHNEAKAKRTCQQKVSHLHLQMEILDAEWQWDFQKLIFYYYADHYINFKDLITDLYRIYKTRIWLSAVNPASFSQHAMGQPPSGIGPGAVTNYANSGGANTSYAMSYGADPDPYGAIPPYRIGYETYTPNYPSIPGVPSSFAPGGQNSASSAANDHGLPRFASNEHFAGHTSRGDEFHSWHEREGFGTLPPNSPFAGRGSGLESAGFDVNSPSNLAGIPHQQHLQGHALHTATYPLTMQQPNLASPTSIGSASGQQSWTWQGPRGMPLSPSADSRSGDAQAPIGTRPGAAGFFSQGFLPSVGAGEGQGSARYPSHGQFSRNHHMMSPTSSASLAGNSSVNGVAPGVAGRPDPSVSAPRNNAAPGGGLRRASMNKQAQVKSYLSNLPDATAGYADEMSRER